MTRLKCTKFDFGRPPWASFQRSPRPSSWIWGPTSKEREREGRGGEGKGGEGREEREGERRGRKGPWAPPPTIWRKFTPMSETGAEWHVNCCDLVEMETRYIEFQYGGHLGEFNGMSSQSHLPHCRELAAIWRIHCHDSRARAALDDWRVQSFDKISVMIVPLCRV